jgi:hypothetical protein
MEVIDFEAQSWFLLKAENDYFLDVNCNYSAFGFSRLIKLTPFEKKEFNSKGRTSITTLANDVQYHATTKYAERHLTGEFEKSVQLAIQSYNKKKNK